MASTEPARASSTTTTDSSSALPSAALNQVATAEAFPVFEEDHSEVSASPSPSPPPSPPRRRSRQVTNLDRAVFLCLPKAKVFNYVDYIKCLRAPPFLPPLSQSGRQGSEAPISSSINLTTTISSPILETAPWAQSRSRSQDQPASSAPLGQMSGLKQQKIANTSQNTT